MTSIDRRALLQDYYESVWNRGEYHRSHDFISPGELHHTQGGHGQGGPDWDSSAAKAFRTAFPDAHFDLELMVEGSDLIAVYWRASGTDARTGTSFHDYTGVNIFRFENGLIAEVWNTRDDLGLFAQLGLIPPRTELAAQAYSAAPRASEQRSG